MKTIQIGCYQDELESITEVAAVREMTEEEFKQQELEVGLFDDGGSHSLHKYNAELVAELKSIGASNIELLD